MAKYTPLDGTSRLGSGGRAAYGLPAVLPHAEW